MLKQWAISGLASSKEEHKETPDTPVGDPMSMEDLDGLDIPPEVMDRLAAARFRAKARAHAKQDAPVAKKRTGD